jgi:hypothetical protein
MIAGRAGLTFRGAIVALAMAVSACAADPAPIAPASASMKGDSLDTMVPKHPTFLGALAPGNLQKKRQKPAFDLTGTWFVDLSQGFGKFRFGSEGYPDFLAPGQQAVREAAEARKKGEDYRDSIGACFPAGLPMVMTRVWPIAMIQLPTVIYVLSGFNNEFRPIYLDGRNFSDPDQVVPSYGGESIGHWEGDTLVVETRYVEPNQHYIDSGIPITDAFRVIERMKLVSGGKQLEIEYIMTDPDVWKGEWRTTKRWNREDYTDINEVHCLPDMNAHLPSTEEGHAAVRAREGGKKH